MTVNTIDPRAFMQPKRLEGVVNKKLETTQSFINMFPVVPTDATSVTYHEDLTTAGADISGGTMAKPLDLGELSGLAKIEVSSITQKHGFLRPFGYEFRISRRDLDRGGTIIDDLTRGVGRAVYGMSDRINSDILDILKNATNDVTEPGSAWTAWSEGDAAPLSNMLDIANAMDLEGYDSEANQLYLQQQNYYELLDYVENVDIAWVQNPMNNGTRTIPQINGFNIHKLKGTGQLAQGAYMALDGRPEYAPITTYAHSQRGMGSDGTFPIINIYQYKEKEGSYQEQVVTEFIAETFHALKAPNSICYRSTGV
jgi:hypothetical protein